MPPTVNTLGLRECMLVKGEEKKQSRRQGESLMNYPDYFGVYPYLKVAENESTCYIVPYHLEEQLFDM